MDESFNAGEFYERYYGINRKADDGATARELIRSCDAFTYLEKTRPLKSLGIECAAPLGSPSSATGCSTSPTVPTT